MDLEATGFEICPKCKSAVIGGVCNCPAPSAVKAEPKDPAPEVVAEAKSVPEQAPVFSTRDALAKIPGAPNEAQIAAWKAQYGAVYSFPFDPKEIYIWRPMNRREWQIFTANEGLMKNEATFQEQVVMRAVLWPVMDPVALSLSRAGLIQTLYGVIMQGSYFLPQEFAITMVEEL